MTTPLGGIYWRARIITPEGTSVAVSTYGWAGSAAGSRTHSGSASGEYGWRGFAGEIVRRGNAEGAYGWSGSAAGETPIPVLPEFDAVENVAMPALIGGRALREARPRALALLETLGLRGRADHRPGQLSGGEQQRVAIARALMNEPRLVLADEPTGNLDTRTAEVLHAEIVRLAREMGQAFVLVTHNPALAALADRVLRLHEGRLVPEVLGAPVA